MKLYSTKDYKIVLGESVEDGNTRPVYNIVNTETNIVEYDDFILPRTIEALLNLQEKLDEANAVFFTDDKTPLTLIGSTTDGKDGLH